MRPPRAFFNLWMNSTHSTHRLATPSAWHTQQNITEDAINSRDTLFNQGYACTKKLLRLQVKLLPSLCGCVLSPHLRQLLAAPGGCHLSLHQLPLQLVQSRSQTTHCCPSWPADKASLFSASSYYLLVTAFNANLSGLHKSVHAMLP